MLYLRRTSTVLLHRKSFILYPTTFISVRSFSRMNDPKSAHVVSFNEVTNENILKYFGVIMNKINDASHVAVDLEFTCLGSIRSLDMAHRYLAMKRTVESAAIASLGISVVKKQTSATIDLPPFAQKYECDNFEFLTLKQGNITIESDTGTFLCNHGYSFDALFTRGIPFTPPADISAEQKTKPDMKLSNLWKHMVDIMRHRKIPLVLHNGLYDLVYIYHSFIGKLPDTFNGFITKIGQCFPSGLYDTRYLAEKAEYDATFLKYVFSKSDRLRQNRFENSTEEKPYFEVQVNAPVLKTIPISGLKRKRDDDEGKVKEVVIIGGKGNGSIKTKKTDYCQQYAERGYCNLGHTGSSKFHDIQIILDSQMGVSKYKQFYTSESRNDDNAHASHFDAYMTSFAFSYFQNTLTPVVMKSSLNKMAISGLHFPLTFPIPANSQPSSQNA